MTHEQHDPQKATDKAVYAYLGSNNLDKNTQVLLEAVRNLGANVRRLENHMHTQLKKQDEDANARLDRIDETLKLLTDREVIKSNAILANKVDLLWKGAMALVGLVLTAVVIALIAIVINNPTKAAGVKNNTAQTQSTIVNPTRSVP